MLHGTAQHRAEVDTFKMRLNGEIDFRSMTYQDLFAQLKLAPGVDGNYLTYLEERYFPA